MQGPFDVRSTFGTGGGRDTAARRGGGGGGGGGWLQAVRTSLAVYCSETKLERMLRCFRAPVEIRDVRLGTQRTLGSYSDRTCWGSPDNFSVRRTVPKYV